MPHRLRKTRKMRGSRTVGYGRVTQHRKSGSRGGKGRAGGHKHKWLHTVKFEPDRFRSIGFISIASLKPSTKIINTGDLERLALLLHSPEQLKSGEAELDLVKMGYGKLLGKGNVAISLKVRISSATDKALEKVEAAGGEVIKPE